MVKLNAKAQQRYGCFDCLHRSEAHISCGNLYCVFVDCPYADILDNYNSYKDYVEKCKNIVDNVEAGGFDADPLGGYHIELNGGFNKVITHFSVNDITFI